MRYYRSGKSHTQYKPKKSWRGFSGQKKRKVIQYEEAATLKYSNPFARKSPRIGVKLRKLVLPFLFFSWIGLVLYLPEFQITNLSYSGLNMIKPEELESEIKTNFFSKNPFIPKNNFFLMREGAVYEHLQSKFLLNGLVVTKEFPNKLHISVTESISSAIFDNGKEYYLLSDNGVAIKYLRSVKPDEFIEIPTDTTSTTLNHTLENTTTTTGTIKTEHVPNYRSLTKDFGNFPIIFDLNEPEVKEREVSISTTTLKGFLAFYNALERGKAVNALYATIKEPSAGMVIYTDKPWKILFQPETDINNQISNLHVILKNSKPVEYVDLRFGDRIYWK